MKVTVSVIDRRTKFGTGNREFFTYYSAYKYIRSNLDRVLSVRAEYNYSTRAHAIPEPEYSVYTWSIPEFISFMDMEEMQ